MRLLVPHLVAIFLLALASSTSAQTTTVCVQQGYTLTSITGSDLLYTGTGNAAGTGTVYQWAIRPCGAVTSLGYCLGEFCQGTTTVSNTNTSAVGNGAIWAQVNTNGQQGVAQLIQDGDSCGVINADREGTIQFLCNQTATTPFISSILETTTCHYQAIIQTSVVCPVAAAGYSTTVGTAILASSSLQQCGGGIYDLTALNSADFYGSINSTSGGTNYTYVVRVCGNLTSTSACSTTPFTSVCQVPTTSPTVGYPLALYQPLSSAVVWTYNGASVSQIIQDGAGCAGQNRFTNITFLCSSSATSPIILSLVEAPTCHYTMLVQTSAVCGTPFLSLPSVAGSSTGSSVRVTSSSTGSAAPSNVTTTCVQQGYTLTSITGSDLLYTGTGNAAGTGTVYQWAIRPCGAVTSLGYCLGEFCQGTTTVSNTNTSAVGNGAIWAQVNTNGQQGVAQLIQDGDSCGVINADREGTIQFLCNQTATTPFISSILETTTCHYQAIIQTSVVCPVAAAGYSTTVGTAILASSSLQQCGGGIYDLTALNSADFYGSINSTSGGTNYTYVVRVCGNLTSTSACSTTPFTSVCQVPTTSPTVGYPLALYQPLSSAVVWTYNGASVSQIIQDGAGCAGQNRFTNITFLCSSSATSPIILSLVEAPTCHYTMLVQTSAVCGTPFLSLPSVAGSSTGSSVRVTSSSTGSAAPSNVTTTCVQQGYTLTSITGSDLLYTGTGNAAGTGTVYQWAIRPCGAVTSLGYCLGEFCQGTTTVSNTNTSAVGNGAIWAQVNTNGQQGVAQLIQDGDSCGVINADREGTIQFLCNQTATTPFISSILETTTCHYQAIIQTSVVCPVAAAGYSTTVGTAILASSSLQQCGGGIYDLTALNSADFYGSINSTSGGTNYTYVVRVCGNLTSTSACSTTPFTSVCQVPTTSPTVGYPLALYQPLSSAVVWTYNGASVSQIIQDGAGCAGQNRFTNITFLCSSSATSPIILSLVEAPTCHYTMLVQTSAVCGTPFAAPTVGSTAAASTAPPSVTSAPSATSAALTSAPSATSARALAATSAPTSAPTSAAAVTSAAGPTPPSSTAASQPNGGGGSSGLSHGAIAGIVIGSVVGALLCLALLLVVCCRGSKGKRATDGGADPHYQTEGTRDWDSHAHDHSEDTDERAEGEPSEPGEVEMH